jgi:hypothetical protein
MAVGMTHDIEKGLSREPTSFDDAKKLFNKEIMPLVKEHLSNPKMKLNSQKKAMIPIEWLTKEGEISEGEPGATKQKKAYMIIIDSGEVEFLALKPESHEYWYHGKLLNDKFMERKMENAQRWKKTGKGDFTWFFFHAKNPPYVITRRAVRKNWMPPHGISALPDHIEKTVPKGMRYWTIKGKSKTQIRELLVRELTKRGMKGTDHSMIVAETPKKFPFTLTHQLWNSPDSDKKQMRWFMNIGYDGKSFSWIFDDNPIMGKSEASSVVYMEDAMKVSGEIGAKRSTSSMMVCWNLRKT